MERRGADVVAIDVPTLEAAEWPAVNRERLEATAREWGLELGRGFRLASEALGSSVERVECHVQELDARADRRAGRLRLQRRDPAAPARPRRGARAHPRRARSPAAQLVILEPFSPRATIRSPRGPVAEFQPLTTPFNWWVAQPGRASGVAGRRRLRADSSGSASTARRRWSRCASGRWPTRRARRLERAARARSRTASPRPRSARAPCRRRRPPRGGRRGRPPSRPRRAPAARAASARGAPTSAAAAPRGAAWWIAGSFETWNSARPPGRRTRPISRT